MAKNIVLLCDGTWQHQHMDHVSNIAKMRNILVRDNNQLVQYQDGIGTDNVRDRLLGGAFANGIDDKIIEMFRFLSENYEAGDQIFIFGFSRGAATARAISHMIHRIGILPRGSKRHREAYECFVEGNANDILVFRQKYNVITGVNIQFLGVFDTVSALGFPTPRDDKHFFGNLTMDLHPNIVAARHALAVDEHRGVFPADVWRPLRGVNTEQRWFAGSHADVGGGYEGSGLSNVTLQWMLRNAVHFGLRIEGNAYDINAQVSFDRNALIEGNNFLPNWNGEIHDSLTFMYGLVGFLSEFRRANYRRMLLQPDETIDPSVFWRLANDANYRPVQLRGRKEEVLRHSSARHLEILERHYDRADIPEVNAPVLPLAGQVHSLDHDN